MYMKNTFLLLSWLILLPSGILANPIKEMLERIDKGASDKFVVELHKSSNDFFGVSGFSWLVSFLLSV